MTPEEKQLLLTDLCARLPYGVKVHTWYNKPIDIKCTGVDVYTNVVNLDIPEDDAKVYIDNVKPHLRPMSSMTEEEKKYISERCGFSIAGPIRNESALIMPVLSADWLIDFYNERHFDYRGLIPMGLALEAHDGMYENF